MAGIEAGTVTGRLPRRDGLLFALIGAVTACLVAVPTALADRSFSARFSANANGDIAVIGNTLESCSIAAADCVRARDGTGTALNNNSFVMERVDVDGNPATFDSSSARLTLPDGARVLFAGLYYGVRTTAGPRGKVAPDSSPAALLNAELKLTRALQL